MLQAMLFLSALDDSMAAAGALEELAPSPPSLRPLSLLPPLLPSPSAALLQLAASSTLAACYAPPLPPPLPLPPSSLPSIGSATTSDATQPHCSYPSVSGECAATPSGACGRCDLSICDSSFLIIGAQSWHATCARCCVCDESLADCASCYLKLGALYCKRDYLA